MLKLMNNIERISQLIPKFKLQLIFLEEREKLFQNVNEYSIERGNSLSNASTVSQAPPNVSLDSLLSSSSSVSTNDSLSKITTNDLTFNEDSSNTDADSVVPFPDVYQIPSLPNALIKDIQEGILDKFGPHCSNRQILIDAVSYDLIENYNLL